MQEGTEQAETHMVPGSYGHLGNEHSLGCRGGGVVRNKSCPRLG